MQMPPILTLRPARPMENALPWPGIGRLQYPRAASPVFDPGAHPTWRKPCAPDSAFFAPPPVVVPQVEGNRAEMVMCWFRDKLAAGFRPDANSCRRVFQTCKYDGRDDLAIRLLDDLLQLGVNPGISNFNLAIQTCLEAGSFEAVKLLFDHLARYQIVWGTTPDKDTCHALIAACNAVHRPEEAAALLLGPGLPSDHRIWRLVADTTAFQEMLGHCSPPTASRLLAQGIKAGAYRIRLGFDNSHNLLDLRRRSVLKKNTSQNLNKPVHPGLAKAVFAELLASGKIDRHTCYDMGQLASPRLRSTLRRCRAEQGWGSAIPFRSSVPAPPPGHDATGGAADPETRSPPSAGSPSAASPNPVPGR